MLCKRKLLDQLVLELETVYQTALTAAKSAHSTATDKANIAENKYDTLALEAAYLAEGQAKRVAQCRADLHAMYNLNALDFTQHDPITIGAKVNLIDQNEASLLLFLAPVSGGLKLISDNQTINVITQSSPLGSKLVGKLVGDEFEFGSGQHKKHYYISAIS